MRHPDFKAPLVARLLLRMFLDANAHEAISGDLAESFAAEIRNPRTRRWARVRFWRLTFASIGACWRHRLVHAAQPPPQTGDGSMQSMFRDIAYGWRVLRKNPGFTATAVLTLAIGIAANTTIFSIVNTMILQPLPYKDPSRLAFVFGWDTTRDQMRFNTRVEDFVAFDEQAATFEHLNAYQYWSANLTGSHERATGEMPERVQAYRVTFGTFEMLGVPPLAGRVFTQADAGRPPTRLAMISHGLWQRRFGGDPAIVGQSITLDGVPHLVLAVMPDGFDFPVYNFKGDVWVPADIDRAAVFTRRTPAGGASFTVVGRLKESATLGEAQADVNRIAARIAASHPDTNASVGARLMPMRELATRELRDAAGAVAGAVGIVLLLACANVANLLLARGVARQRELGIRVALGAGRVRLLRQLITETILLTAAGAAAGAVLASWALSAFRQSLPEIILKTMPNLDTLAMNTRTLAFTIAISIATGLLFGLVPAIRAVRGDLHGALRESGRSGVPRGSQRLRAVLVAGEVALSFVLLVATGLMIRSLTNLLQVDVGFKADHVVTFSVALPGYKYATAPSRLEFFTQALDRLNGLAGVEHAAVVNVLPFSTYNRGTGFNLEGRAVTDSAAQPRADLRIVSDRYFAALRIPVRRGRTFAPGDQPGAVVVINDALRRREFGGEDPIGRRVQLGGIRSQEAWAEIIGVIGDVRHSTLTDEPEPEIYVPLAKIPASMMMVAVRGAGVNPPALTAAVRAELRRVDPAQPIYEVSTLDGLVDTALMPHRSVIFAVTMFGVVALLLAAVGIYGVIAYAVGLQRHEIGVRMALGASPSDVVRFVLGRGFVIIGAGLAAGAAVAFGVTRALGTMLFNVRPADPLTYAAMIVLVAVVALAACYVPARRAMRVDPVEALRAE